MDIKQAIEKDKEREASGFYESGIGKILTSKWVGSFGKYNVGVQQQILDYAEAVALEFNSQQNSLREGPKPLRRYTATHTDHPLFDSPVATRPPAVRIFDVYEYTPERARNLAMICAFDLTDVLNWSVTANNEVPAEVVTEPQSTEIYR